jgi:hypothetical protein
LNERFRLQQILELCSSNGLRTVSGKTLVN